VDTKTLTLTGKGDAIHWVPTAFLTVAVLLEPFYFFESGLPQPADAFFVIAIAAALPGILRASRTLNGWFLYSLILFNLWVFSVNCLWMGILNDLSGFRYAAYISYNSCICLLGAWLARSNRAALYPVALTACTALVLESVLVFIDPADRLRETGSTNNPNQLAFWSLNAFALVIFLENKMRVRTVWSVVAGVSSTILVYVSVSKAAAAGLAALLTMYALRSRSGLLALIVAVGSLFFMSPEVQSFWGVRLGNSEGFTGGSNPERRGFDRVIEYPNYLLFGASELDPARLGYHIEIHSTYLNLLFAYGFFGLAAFLCLLAGVIVAQPYRALMVLSPSLVYGLAHNGIRSSMMWLLLGIIVGSPSAFQRARA
jgi:hypothetical protein